MPARAARRAAGAKVSGSGKGGGRRTPRRSRRHPPPRHDQERGSPGGKSRQPTPEAFAKTGSAAAKRPPNTTSSGTAPKNQARRHPMRGTAGVQCGSIRRCPPQQRGESSQTGVERRSHHLGGDRSTPAMGAPSPARPPASGSPRRPGPSTGQCLRGSEGHEDGTAAGRGQPKPEPPGPHSWDPGRWAGIAARGEPNSVTRCP
jgi:hypothetical protein